MKQMTRNTRIALGFVATVIFGIMIYLGFSLDPAWRQISPLKQTQAIVVLLIIGFCIAFCWHKIKDWVVDQTDLPIRTEINEEMIGDFWKNPQWESKVFAVYFWYHGDWWFDDLELEEE